MGQITGVGASGGALWGSLSQLAVEDCFGAVSGWIIRSVSEAMWAAYSKVWQEWLSLVHWAEVDQEGPEV